jgi:4-amino-4-deoxy-L-arabinose transferase-like glycosyltransferase
MQQASGFIKLTATLIGFTGAALAVMTKGLIGILFPLAIIGLWIACFQTRFPFKKSHLFVGSCLFFIIVTPWHVLAGARNPGFYYFYFIEQHFLRYTIKSVGHYQPIWFFIPCLLIGFFPWIVFLPQAIKDSIPTTWQQRTQRQTEMYFLIWSVVIFLFFSFSKSKLTPYILPIFPPLAILTGRYLASHMTDPHKMRLGFYLLPGMALVVASYLGIHAHQSSVGQTAIYFYWDAGIILFGSLLATYMGLCHQAKRGIIAIISIMLVFLLIAMKAFPGMDMRNTQQLSAVLKPLLNTHSVVATYEKYYQDLPFYLGRRVTIIGWTNELSFGIEHQDTHEWTLNQDDFISFWNKHPSAFVITQRSLYPEMQSRFPQVKLCLLAETSYDVLLGKCSSRKTI